MASLDLNLAVSAPGDVIVLALDSSIPDSIPTPSIKKFVLPTLAVFGAFAAADAFTGIVLPLPEFRGSVDGIVLAGWASHFLGIICLFAALFLVWLRKTGYSPAVLVLYFFGLVLVIAGALMHTTRMEANDFIIPFSNQKSTATQLQWFACAILYVFFSYLAWTAPVDHPALISQELREKHQLLISIRQAYHQLHALQDQAKMQVQAMQSSFQSSSALSTASTDPNCESFFNAFVRFRRLIFFLSSTKQRSAP